MKTKTKRIILLILLLIMVLAVFPAAISAEDDRVTYLDEEGQERYVNDDCITHDEISGTYFGGWLYVDESFTLNDRIEVYYSDLHIILGDGCTLTLAKGIRVRDGYTLYIHWQSDKTGKLIAYAPERCAAIGGNDKEGCGTVIICGGNIVATATSDGAGIGGGNEPSNRNANCVIKIYDGNIEATGGIFGAGIGGGDISDGGKISIFGGTVKAFGGKEAAGIGGGDEGDGGTITIYGGTVEATSGLEGAGIGGGNGDGNKYGNGGTITIKGGNVKAEAQGYPTYAYYSDDVLSAGIGGGTEGGAGNITIEEGAVVFARGNRGGAGIGSGCDVNKKSDKSRIGGTIKISGGRVEARTYDPAQEQYGTTGGGAAGIGSGRHSPGCNITISGGWVYAIGTNKKRSDFTVGGAGIGNSQKSDGGSVTITGGEITAYSYCTEASFIGKGSSGNGPTCTLDYPTCRVSRLTYKENDNVYYLAAEREAAAFQKVEWFNITRISIKPCDHEDGVIYGQDEHNHFGICKFCNNTVNEEHVWQYTDLGDQHSRVCKVCGYDGGTADHDYNTADDKCECGVQGIRIHFVSNGGSGTMADVFLRKGEYLRYLPECTFSAPAGQGYVGWKIDGEGDVLQPGIYWQKPDKSFTLVAQWGDSWASLQA